MKAEILLRVLLPIKSGLDTTHDALARYIFKLNERLLRTTKTQEELKALKVSLSTFRKPPEDLAKSLLPNNSKYKDTVCIYFILKQISAMYEAESKRLPIQVFNEMRNALDHFIRSLIYPDEEGREASSIEQMNRHIQRAFLDTSKLLCALYDESAKERHAKFSDETIGLLNEGDYQKEFTRLQVASHEAFTKAKLLDYKLGTDGESSVRDEYIKAVIAHSELLEYQSANYHRLKWAAARIRLRQGLKWGATIIASLIAGALLENYDALSAFWES